MSAPAAIANLKDGSVFSGAIRQYPRWPITSDRWLATSFSAGMVFSEAFISKATKTRLMVKAAPNKSSRKGALSFARVRLGAILRLQQAQMRALNDHLCGICFAHDIGSGGIVQTFSRFARACPMLH